MKKYKYFCLSLIGLAAFLSLKFTELPERKLVWHDEFDYSGLPASTKWVTTLAMVV